MSKFILKRIIAAGVGSIGIYDPAELRGPSNKNILFVRTDLDHTDMEITDRIVISQDSVIRMAGDITSIKLEVSELPFCA